MRISMLVILMTALGTSTSAIAQGDPPPPSDLEWVRAVVASLAPPAGPADRPIAKRETPFVTTWAPKRTAARFKVEHIDLGVAAHEVRAALEPLTEDQVTIVTDEATQSLHVLATEVDHARIQGMLSVLDTARKPAAAPPTPVVLLVRVKGVSGDALATALEACSAAVGNPAAVAAIEGTDRVVIAGSASSVKKLADIARRLGRNE